MSALWEPEVTTADTIAITPFGTIEATTLQDALEEIVDDQNSIVSLSNLVLAQQLGAL